VRGERGGERGESSLLSLFFLLSLTPSLVSASLCAACSSFSLSLSLVSRLCLLSPFPFLFLSRKEQTLSFFLFPHVQHVDFSKNDDDAGCCCLGSKELQQTEGGTDIPRARQGQLQPRVSTFHMYCPCTDESLPIHSQIDSKCTADSATSLLTHC
jgi:hypothetical protein